MPPPLPHMGTHNASSASSSVRDRTSEFLTIADRLKKAPGAVSTNGEISYALSNGVRPGERSVPAGGVPSGGTGGAAMAAGMQAEFNRRASRIGLSIHHTSQKLAKLAKLAKRTSMFDDPAVEIQELTAVIKQDITALNAAIADLQNLCDSQRESSNSGQRNKHSSEHSVTVVDSLKTRLMSTTKEFKDVLTLRTENLKVHENRRQLFSATTSTGTGAAQAFQPLSQNPVPTFQRVRPLPSSSSPPPWASANGNSSSSSSTSQAAALFSTPSRRSDVPLLAGHQQQQQQQELVPVQDQYLASRAEALHNVESTIVELSGIFRDLATMVQQQGEMAIRIDQDMEDTLVNVEGAQASLLKYLNRISSNRWLVIKIFLVLLIFLLIFVVFVA